MQPISIKIEFRKKTHFLLERAENVSFFIQGVLKSLKGYIEDIFLIQQTISIATLEGKRSDFTNELYFTSYRLKSSAYQSRTSAEQGELCYWDSGKKDYDFSYTIENENSIYTDIIEAPLYMVSETISRVVTMYDPSVITKRVSLVNREKKTLRKYQLLLLEPIDCLHESSEFYPDKTVKRFILDKEKVKGQEIFQVAGVDRMDVIVSLNIAESVLRRDVFGVQFQEICCN